jgi:hypothetical protein
VNFYVHSAEPHLGMSSLKAMPVMMPATSAMMLQQQTAVQPAIHFN